MTEFLTYLDAHPWAMWAVGTIVAGLFSLLMSKRSQIDDWAESNPRVAGVMKLLRGLGIDPWLIVQGVALIVTKRLPATKPTSKLPPLTIVTLALVCLGLSGCANWKPAARTANDLAAELCALTVSELQGLSFEDAMRTACDTHEKVKPFLDELLAAQKAAGAKAGLTK